MTESDIGEAGRSHGLSARVVLRAVAPEDEEFLLRVYAGTREEELAQVAWEEGQREAFLRHQFDAQREQYFARFPDAVYSVILYDGAPAGRIWVARTEEQIRLLDIAILDEYQNLGVGKHLVGELIAESETSGKPVRHMVFKLNAAGLRFYERLGFTVIDDVGAYLHMERRPAARGGAGNYGRDAREG